MATKTPNFDKAFPLFQEDKISEYFLKMKGISSFVLTFVFEVSFQI